MHAHLYGYVPEVRWPARRPTIFKHSSCLRSTSITPDFPSLDVSSVAAPIALRKAYPGRVAFAAATFDAGGSDRARRPRAHAGAARLHAALAQGAMGVKVGRTSACSLRDGAAAS